MRNISQAVGIITLAFLGMVGGTLAGLLVLMSFCTTEHSFWYVVVPVAYYMAWAIPVVLVVIFLILVYLAGKARGKQ